MSLKNNGMDPKTHSDPRVLEGWRKYLMLAYNIVLALLLSGLLIYHIAFSPHIEPESTPSALTESSSDMHVTLAPNVLLVAMLTMAIAGSVGATLCNLRGLFKYNYEKGGLPTELEQPYYLRPLIGAVTGLSILFVGHLITSALSDVSNLSWATLTGRLPYVGVALLAGFASHEFTERMKAVAETLFSQNALGPADQLRKLKQLKDEGLLSGDEYNQKRKSLINKL